MEKRLVGGQEPQETEEMAFGMPKHRWRGCDNYPEKLKTTADLICRIYNIKGFSDAPYIANLIAQQLGFGDGEGNFTSFPQ